VAGIAATCAEIAGTQLSLQEKSHRTVGGLVALVGKKPYRSSGSFFALQNAPCKAYAMVKIVIFAAEK